jgi:hypothetical protein
MDAIFLFHFATQKNPSGGRCYNHNFRRFSPKFGEKPILASFLQNLGYAPNFAKKLAVVCTKKRQFFTIIFRRKFLKIITSVPGATIRSRLVYW